MSGLFGLHAPDSSVAQRSSTVGRMADLLHGSPTLTREGPCSIGPVTAGRYRARLDSDVEQPVRLGDRYHLWFRGELYVPMHASGTASAEAQVPDDPRWFLSQLVSGADVPGFLQSLEGTFSAVLYDAEADCISLISDRFGLHPLYWTTGAEGFVWCSELKGMLALPRALRIDSEAVKQYLGIGYLIGSRSWLAGIDLLPAATILTWSAGTKQVSQVRYWHWGSIRTKHDGVGATATPFEAARLFIAGVEKRCQTSLQLGMHLSGGLDSRAILGAIPEATQAHLRAITFGLSDSDDVRLARRVAQLKGIGHTWFPINPDHWVQKRLRGVWECDGGISMLHLHSYPFLGAISELFDINLTGAGGDGVFGGGHLFEPAEAESYARRLGLDVSRFPTVLDAFVEHFRELGDSHALYVEHRIRRFSMGSAQLARRAGIEWRFPFLDNSLQDLLFALPYALRRSGQFYKQILLGAFPELFKHIPTDKSGLPIGAGPLQEALKNRLCNGRVGRTLRFAGLGKFFPVGEPFARYAEWIRQPEAWGRFQFALTGAARFLPEYVPRAGVAEALDAHARGSDRSEEICRYLTLEIWLRYLNAGPEQAKTEELGFGAPTESDGMQ